MIGQLVLDFIRASHSTGVLSRSPSDSILFHIRKQRLADVSFSRCVVPIEVVQSQLHSAPPLIDWRARTEKAFPTAVFAEIKRASPSKGDIAPDANAESVSKACLI